MTEDPVGGRVLVVAPPESGDDPDGSAARGDASGTDSGGVGPAGGSDASECGERGRSGHQSADDGPEPAGERDASDPAGEDGSGPTDGRDRSPREASDTDGYRASAADDTGCDPETVASGLADRLPAEVVFRDERTAGEYLAELGPTIDCVVTLGCDTGPLGELAEDVSIPAIVCDRPIVEGETSAPAPLTLDEVADRVRTIVREARSRSDLRDQNARLTALSRYARDITGCETVDAVLDRTLEAATDALAFDYCVILLVDGDRLVPRASVLPDPDLSPCGVTEGIAGRTLQSGDAELVADMQSDPDARPEHDDLHAVLSVPIGSQGVLQAASHSRDTFDEHDKEFAEILSGYTREALARLEREVTLRAERDRLHGFYMTVPVPVLCVERRNGDATVTDTNDAYEGTLSADAVGQPLSAALPTDAERDRYEAALDGKGLSRGTVSRRVDGRQRDVALTVIPVSPPDGSDHAFGVYQAERVAADGRADDEAG